MLQKTNSLSINTVEHDGLDRAILEELLGKSKELKGIQERGARVLKTWEPLLEDVFFSLYKPSYRLLDYAELVPQYLFNRQEIERLLESPFGHEVRQYTSLDEFGAGLGAKALLENLLQSFQHDPRLQELAKRINEAEVKREYIENLEKQIQDSPQKKELIKELSEALKEAKEKSEQLEIALGTLNKTLGRILNQAAEKAAKECAAVECIIYSWGWEKGEFQRLPLERKLELVKLLREQAGFRKLTDMVGRMRNLAIGSRKTKLEQIAVELHSITLGDQIQRALPQELAALRKKYLRLNLYKKMMEKQLLQYDLNSRDKAGQGPIIALIDTSGSMQSGDRLPWAKATAMGLLEIAIRERRAFAYAVFSGAHDEIIADSFSPGERSPEKAIRMAEAYIGGGTDYEKPLRWAMAKMQETQFTKGDIVLISDGVCNLTKEFREELNQQKEARNFSIYSVLIGENPKALEGWSDQVWRIDDLLDEGVVEEIFKRI